MGVLRVKVAGQWIDVGTSTVALAAGRNLLDNGQMAVKQRATTGFALSSALQFLSDRWGLYNNGVGVINVGVAAFGAGALAAGRPRPGNQQYFTVATGEAAGALAVGDYWQIAQGIEGQFLQHLNWGTPGAQSLTVSFDIYSSVAGNYVVELYRQETAQRSISALVTVPAGWSTQSVTFPGDTAAGITNDNASRLVLVLALTGGSTYTSGVLQSSWGAVVNANRWPGMTNTIAATAGNQIVVTNVQMEIGTQATPYEVRDYVQELQKCRRYFETTGYVLNATVPPYIPGYWTAQKRAIPTVTHAPQAGTGAVFNIVAGYGEGSMFYQNSNHSVAALTLVTGNSEI